MGEFFREHGVKVGVALLLSFASGLVDITGYLGVFQLFTAHVTGTTVQLGQALITHHWDEVRAALAIIVAFVFGSLFGRVLIEMGSRKGIRKIASLTLAAESLLLLSIAYDGFSPTRNLFWRLAILASAMGIQTAILTRIGPLTVHTTFVTGMVNKFAQLVSHILFRGYDRMTTGAWNLEVHQEQKKDLQMAIFLFCVWLCYVLGAAFGAVVFRTLQLRALIFAVVILAVSLATDQIWPLAVREEKEQSEE